LICPEDKKSPSYSRQIISSFENALLRFFLTLDRGIPSKDRQWTPPKAPIQAITPSNEAGIVESTDD
jgi:hypothetical protein